MNKISVFKKLYNEYVKQDQYLDSIPMDIRGSVFDNEYANSLNSIIEQMKKAIFAEEELEYVNWFLYEWTFNNDDYIEVDGKEYRFGTIDEYIEFLTTKVWLK